MSGLLPTVGGQGDGCAQSKSAGHSTLKENSMDESLGSNPAGGSLLPELALGYDWIYDRFSGGQRAAFQALLETLADWVWPETNPTRVNGWGVTGGQDNVQAVAGQMLMFFSELGFETPQFPFIAHSRGWSAEDMENNIAYVKRNKALHDGAKELAERTVEKARELLGMKPTTKVEHAGRKGGKIAVVEE